MDSRRNCHSVSGVFATHRHTHTRSIRVCPYLRANRWRQCGCSQKNWSPRSGCVVTAARDFYSYDRNPVCRLLLQGHRIKVCLFFKHKSDSDTRPIHAHSPNFPDNVVLVLAWTTKTELEEHFLCQDLKDCCGFFLFLLFLLYAHCCQCETEVTSKNRQEFFLVRNK